ncbi:MAG: hypothetical protein ACI33K_01970 [Clostridiaceae bacterium]
MEEKYKKVDEFTMISKGILFGTGAGLIMGLFHRNPGLTMTFGAVAGIVVAEVIRMIMYIKSKNRV